MQFLTTPQINEINEINEAMSTPIVFCPRCGCPLALGLKIIEEYFMGKTLVCQHCGLTTNAWDAFLVSIGHPHPFIRDQVASFVGYQTKHFSVSLAAGDTIEIDFSKYGVPPRSRLIRVNYTAVGDHPVHPIELHSNDVPLRRSGNIVSLYGRPYELHEKKCIQPPTTVCVKISFFENTANEYTQAAMAKAFEAMFSEEFEEMVIPAIMAVEFSCKYLATKQRIDISGVKDKNLLSDIIISRIASSVSVPPLAEEIQSKIKRLWGQRDSVAHKGCLHQPYNIENARPQLSAALFAFYYCQFLGKKLTAD